jgi:hypothetical protein
MPVDTDRRAERRRWPARVVRPGEAPIDDDLSATTSREERVHMMWELAQQAWSVARIPVPGYARPDMPARVIRPASR